MGRKLLSALGLLLVAAALLVLVTVGDLASRVAFAAAPFAVTFDFDTGLPTLSEGQNIPFNQTSGEITAHFSSPLDPAAFSVQSESTTFFKLSQFSGKYLYDNVLRRDSLIMKFNQSLTSISLTFATIEYHGGPGVETSNITLTAYMDSTATTPVGSAIARGTWPSGDSWPQGTLTFNAGSQQFNLVGIELPYQGPTAAVDFLVDNVIVTTAPPIADTTPPVTTMSLSGVLGDQGWYTSDVTTSLSATDDLSGVAKTEYSFDNVVWTVYTAPFTLTAGGTTTIYYRSTDNAGNIEAVKSQAVKVDKASPATTISPSGVLGNQGWYTSTVTMALSATDDWSGVAKTEYSFDNVAWTTYATSFTIASEGTTIVYYRSTDTAGNVEAVKTQTVKIDKTAPTGSVVINGGSALTTSASVTLTLTPNDAASGVYLVRYSNDGVWDTEQWEILSPTKTWTLTAGNGTKIVYYQIKDNAGLVSLTYQDSITLETTSSIVDTTKPIANAGQDRTVNASETLVFDAGASSDNVGIVSYEWDCGDGTTDTGKTITHTYDSPGTYTVTLTAKDAAGNMATHSITVRVLPAPVGQAFPLWPLLIIVAIGIGVTATFFLRKRK